MYAPPLVYVFHLIPVVWKSDWDSEWRDYLTRISNQSTER